MMLRSLVALLAIVSINCFDQIQIEHNGETKTMYLATGGAASGSGSSFTINHNGRIYIAEKDSGSQWQSDMYFSPNLLGSEISYDVDLSQSKCSCNAALYLVSMPGYDQSGNPWPSDSGTYYCDANKVDGNWCPEMDIMEANQYAYAVTPHKCDAPSGKHYWHCDQGGCGQHLHQQGGAYGPGSGHTIDTTKPFNVKTEFIASNNQLTEIKTTLSQESRTFESYSSRSCDSGYLSLFGSYLQNGMTIVASNWGDAYDTMSWLDGDTGCSGNCDNNPNVVFSNIKVKSSTGPDPPEPGTGYGCNDGGCSSGSGTISDFGQCLSSCTSSYSFGDACEHNNDGLCTDECQQGQCKWSWPNWSDWSDPDANCRCQASWTIKVQDFLA